MRCSLALVAALLAGCAAPQLTIFGERHDQVDQQRQVADVVADLGGRGALRAVVLEMADRGTSTIGLPRDADEAAARQALAWVDRSWPWAQYGPVVMAALRAGVPVWGGNLPRPAMRAAMDDPSLDTAVPPDLAARLSAAIRDGHCGLLPAGMEPGMRRIQVARDRSMAAVVSERLADPAQPGQVLLLTGAQHASRDRGVPWHLVAGDVLPPHAIRVVLFAGDDDGLHGDERRAAEFTPGPDRCEALQGR